MFHHLFRLVDLDIVLRGGTFYARWLPDLGFFYGYPVLNFYAPLVYYITLLFHWLGGGFFSSLKVSYALSFFVAALGAYLWSRDFWSHRAALAVSIVYTFAPYHLANAYVRAALAEHWAQALMPWILFSIERFRQEVILTYNGETLRQREELHPFWHLLPIPLAFSVALIVLIHNLSAFLFLPFAFLYILLRGKGLRGMPLKRFWVGTVVAFLTAALLSAFYWFPALTEVRWIRAGVIGREVTQQASQLATFQELLSPYVIYRYYPNQGVAFEHPLSWWMAAWVTMGALAALLRIHRLTSAQRRVLGVAALLLVISTLLMLKPTALLWTRVPGFAFVQFPWRLQTVVSLTAAIFVAPLMDFFPHALPNALTKRRAWLFSSPFLVTLVLIVSAVTALPYLPWESLTWPDGQKVQEADLSFRGMAQYDYINGLFAREYGDPWLMEYLPTTVNTPREEFWLPNSSRVDSNQANSYRRPAKVVLERVCPTRYTLVVESKHPTLIRWHQFWFPGWRATLDGQNIDTRPSPRLGLVTLSVPVGKHRIDIYFGSTRARAWGWGLSLFGLYLFLLPFAHGRERLFLLVLLFALLAWTGLWAWQNRTRSTCVEPRPALLTIGPKAQVGFLGCATNVHASPVEKEILPLTAYWMALEPIPEDWKAFVHVLDRNGQTIAQHDAFPGENFSPTSRWEVGEIVPDYHTIQLPTPLPPNWQVRIGMYEFSDGIKNLPMRTWLGEDKGSVWEGSCTKR